MKNDLNFWVDKGRLSNCEMYWTLQIWLSEFSNEALWLLLDSGLFLPTSFLYLLLVMIDFIEGLDSIWIYCVS